jgi:hypothetical protein
LQFRVKPIRQRLPRMTIMKREFERADGFSHDN